MQTSPISGITYPNLTDVPNIPTHIQTIAQTLDTIVIPKFSSAANRDATITSPTDGQHCFLTDSQAMFVYRGDYATWLPYQRGIFKAKSANETLGNSTTLQDDNHLAGYTLKATTVYCLRGLIMTTSPAAADIKIALSFSVAPTTGTWAEFGTIGGGVCDARTGTIGTTYSVPTQGSPSVEFITLVGTFTTAASPGTMTFQWAKVGADAGTTTVFGGSYIELLEV